MLGGNHPFFLELTLLRNLVGLYLVFLFRLLLLYIFLVSSDDFISCLSSISPFANTLFLLVIATPICFAPKSIPKRSEEHTSELQSRFDLVCRLLLEKKKHINIRI